MCEFENCTCHKVKRSFSFNSSKSDRDCWCGLLKDFSYSIPICMNVSIWKCFTNNIIDIYGGQMKEALTYLYDKVPVYCYLFGDVIVGKKLSLETSSQSRVYRAIKLNSDGSYRLEALKILHKNVLLNQERVIYKPQNMLEYITEFDMVVKEILIQSVIDHPNIIQLKKISVSKDQNVLAISLEHCPKQCVQYVSSGIYRYVHQKKTFLYTPDAAASLIKKVLQALKYLQGTHNIVHKDIKPENVLIKFLPSQECLVEDSDIDSRSTASNFSDCTNFFLWENNSDQFFTDEASQFEEDFDSEIDLTVDKEQEEYIRLKLKSAKSQMVCVCCGYNMLYNNVVLKLNESESSDNSRSRCCCCKYLLKIPVENDSISESREDVKIIDFGTAVQTESPDLPIYDSEGTYLFSPPECLSVKVELNGGKRDIWCLGKMKTVVYRKVYNSFELYLVLSETSEFSIKTCGIELYNKFFNSCCKKNPSLRVNVDEALNMLLDI